ncbi:hypothetical protein NX059_002050 [Plenodomus lindquistii]|nr:hypothetical protein NX059_002050 [Plenodomus lindquistii]
MEMNPTTSDLTTVDGLRTYLTTQGQPSSSAISLLSGGSANYVYRVTDPNGSARIYKHAAPYSHSNHAFALDVQRMDYEARILSLMPSLKPEAIVSDELTVHAARLMSYDETNKLLCIGDGGSRNLKAAYEDATLDVQRIGQALAKWVATLHKESKDTSLALPSLEESKSGRNNPVALHLYRHSYDNLHVALKEFGHDPDLGVKINEEYGSLLATDDECVCHGDFWPGNILIQSGGTQGVASELTVVDWELVRRGTSATDVGQFAAEAYLHDRFKGGRGMLVAFLDAYLEARSGVVGKTWFKRMIVHWAVHIAFWPTRVAWTVRKGTQELVDMGVDVLKAVLGNDWKVVVGSRLLQDVKHILGPMLA